MLYVIRVIGLRKWKAQISAEVQWEVGKGDAWMESVLDDGIQGKC